MPNQRLINCDFFLKGAFDDVSSNKAKLLYFYFFINADDMGFVGNASKIIRTLNEESAEESGLVQYTFENAADDLVSKGFLFLFTDKHQNRIYLIRHWFMHNKPNYKYCTTNYLSLRAKVEIIDGCYELKENHLRKENKVNKDSNVSKNQKDTKVIEEKVENDNEEDDDEMSWNEIMNTLNAETENASSKNPNDMTFEEILKGEE